MRWMMLLFITMVILLIILIIRKISPSRSMKTHIKGAYLNYASTNAKQNGTLNPSDLAYPQVMEQREELNQLIQRIKKLVNAPVDAKVIFNSGATESIANCVFWAKSYNKYGTIMGSEYDHSAVADNCKNMDIPYNATVRSGKLDDRCSMIFLTHVNAKTGEIANIQNFINNVINRYNYLYNEPFNPYITNVQQYRPLIVLDATQSIMKVPIDMERWKLNAVFFSLHKIGGPIGMGVMVIQDTSFAPFKPLIAGKQQQELRGGTFPLNTFLYNENLFDTFDDFNVRKEAWTQGLKQLKDSGLNVYEPKHSHLYNTYLIKVDSCPLGIINNLALKGIYVGNISACANETAYNKAIVKSRSRSRKGGNNDKNNDTDSVEDKFIRLSFAKPEEVNSEVLTEIVNAIKKED